MGKVVKSQTGHLAKFMSSKVFRSSHQRFSDQIQATRITGILSGDTFTVSVSVENIREDQIRQLARSVAGTCPLYRPMGYKAEDRSRKKLISKRSWYKPFSTVLFCPPTPGSQLATELRRIVDVET